MKVTDLMVGDYVCFDGDVNYDNPIRIQQIGYQGENDIVADNDVFGVEDIIPIPLTEDILVKNGFDKDERSKYFHVYTLNIKGSYDFDICWSSVNGFNYEGDFMLTYVHQLQHLLRLVGVQKEIKL